MQQEQHAQEQGYPRHVQGGCGATAAKKIPEHEDVVQSPGSFDRPAGKSHLCSQSFRPAGATPERKISNAFDDRIEQHRQYGHQDQKEQRFKISTRHHAIEHLHHEQRRNKDAEIGNEAAEYQRRRQTSQICQ